MWVLQLQTGTGASVKFSILAAFIFVSTAMVAPTCTPTPTEPPPEPEPPPDPTAHCSDSCTKLQVLGCKLGNFVCAGFDDAGECSSMKPCVEACKDAPHAYPKGVISECP